MYCICTEIGRKGGEGREREGNGLKRREGKKKENKRERKGKKGREGLNGRGAS